MLCTGLGWNPVPFFTEAFATAAAALHTAYQALEALARGRTLPCSTATDLQGGCCSHEQDRASCCVPPQLTWLSKLLMAGSDTDPQSMTCLQCSSAGCQLWPSSLLRCFSATGSSLRGLMLRQALTLLQSSLPCSLGFVVRLPSDTQIAVTRQQGCTSGPRFLLDVLQQCSRPSQQAAPADLPGLACSSLSWRAGAFHRRAAKLLEDGHAATRTQIEEDRLDPLHMAGQASRPPDATHLYR